jgi:hypothetical protein
MRAATSLALKSSAVTTLVLSSLAVWWRPRATSRVAGRLGRCEDAPEPAARATEQPHEPDGRNTRFGEMYSLTQRVARAQHRNKAGR